MSSGTTRWDILGTAAFVVVVVGGVAALAVKAPQPDLGPVEDLMREHGIVRRVMLVYDEAIRRLGAGEELPVGVVLASSGIVRRVIEDYHEKLEESFVFPQFQKADEQAKLVDTLKKQHDAGRALTDQIAALTRAPLKDDAEKKKLSELLASFNRMYRPHAAREDTVLFPKFHAMLDARAYAAPGEQFEQKERQQLGENGFEKAVAELAALENRLGIGDLAKLTPPPSSPE